MQKNNNILTGAVKNIQVSREQVLDKVRVIRKLLEFFSLL